MGFFKKLFKKLNEGFFFIVDKDTLMECLKRNLDFAIEHNLELATVLNIYIYSEKHEIMICNYATYKGKGERRDGIGCFYDDYEYGSLAELYHAHLENISGYFKVEDPNGEDTFLSDYMNTHPELRVEDYENTIDCE